MNGFLQDVVDPVIDEMLAKFVVDSHFKSQAKGAHLGDKPLGHSQEDAEAFTMTDDPEVYNCVWLHTHTHIHILDFSTFLTMLDCHTFLELDTVLDNTWM